MVWRLWIPEDPIRSLYFGPIKGLHFGPIRIERTFQHISDDFLLRHWLIFSTSSLLDYFLSLFFSKKGFRILAADWSKLKTDFEIVWWHTWLAMTSFGSLFGSFKMNLTWLSGIVKYAIWPRPNKSGRNMTPNDVIWPQKMKSL